MMKNEHLSSILYSTEISLAPASLAPVSFKFIELVI